MIKKIFIFTIIFISQNFSIFEIYNLSGKNAKNIKIEPSNAEFGGSGKRGLKNNELGTFDANSITKFTVTLENGPQNASTPVTKIKDNNGLIIRTSQINDSKIKFAIKSDGSVANLIDVLKQKGMKQWLPVGTKQSSLSYQNLCSECTFEEFTLSCNCSGEGENNKNKLKFNENDFPIDYSDIIWDTKQYPVAELKIIK